MKSPTSSSLQRLVPESLSANLKQIYSYFLYIEYDTSKKLSRHDTFRIESSKLSYSNTQGCIVPPYRLIYLIKSKTHRFLNPFLLGLKQCELHWKRFCLVGDRCTISFFMQSFIFIITIFYYFDFINIFCFQTLRAPAIFRNWSRIIWQIDKEHLFISQKIYEDKRYFKGKELGYWRCQTWVSLLCAWGIERLKTQQINFVHPLLFTTMGGTRHWRAAFGIFHECTCQLHIMAIIKVFLSLNGKLLRYLQ